MQNSANLTESGQLSGQGLVRKDLNWEMNSFLSTFYAAPPMYTEPVLPCTIETVAHFVNFVLCIIAGIAWSVPKSPSKSSKTRSKSKSRADLNSSTLKCVAACTVRGAVSTESNEVRKLQIGDMVQVLDRDTFEGHQRVRIADDAWASQVTAKGLELLVEAIAESAELRAEAIGRLDKCWDLFVELLETDGLESISAKEIGLPIDANGFSYAHRLRKRIKHVSVKHLDLRKNPKIGKRNIWTVVSKKKQADPVVTKEFEAGPKNPRTAVRTIPAGTKLAQFEKKTFKEFQFTHHWTTTSSSGDGHTTTQTHSESPPHLRTW